ncbi:MAG TPA: TlpA disulfide reductase family protein [Puia sp.]|jgi:peroxiredoxin
MQIIKTLRTTVCCTILTTALSLGGRAQKGANSFIIEGSFVNMTAPEKVYLAYDTAHYLPTDSTIVTNGKYSFRGSTDGVAHLFISKKWWDRRAGGWEFSVVPADRAELFVEKGTVQVISTSGDMEKSMVTGSLPDQDYRTAHHHQDLLMDSLRALVKIARDTKNMALLEKTKEQVTKFEPVMKTEYLAFIRQHPASSMNPYLIEEMTRNTPVAGWIDTLANLYHTLPASVRSSHDGMALGRFLDSELKTALGHVAPDFTQKDVEGHSVSLSSFKGKYVLLDFWASSENNAAQSLSLLAKAYEVYGSKGLVVLGVSLDKDKESWQHVIQEAGAGSTEQVSDLNGRENAAAQLYMITRLPRNMLIDPAGIIVARDLNPITLGKTLSSIFE